MRKNALVMGLMMATMLTISACGSKNTTETTTPAETTTEMAATTEAETTMADETTQMDTTQADSSQMDTTGESTITSDNMESETAGDLTADQIKSFAEEVQAAVAGEDLGWLADLNSYPVYVSMASGEGSDVKSKEDFMNLGKDKIFTDKLKKEIAAVKPENLEMFGAGVIMGDDVSITFNNVDGKPAITSIIL